MSPLQQGGLGIFTQNRDRRGLACSTAKFLVDYLTVLVSFLPWGFLTQLTLLLWQGPSCLIVALIQLSLKPHDS